MSRIQCCFILLKHLLPLIFLPPVDQELNGQKIFTTSSLQFVFKTHTMILHMATACLRGSLHKCPISITICQRRMDMKRKIIDSQHGSYVPGYNVCDCYWGKLSSHQSCIMAISLGSQKGFAKRIQRTISPKHLLALSQCPALPGATIHSHECLSGGKTLTATFSFCGNFLSLLMAHTSPVNRCQKRNMTKHWGHR